METHVTPEIIFEAVQSFCIGLGIDGLETYEESATSWKEVCAFANDLISEDYQFDDPSPFKVVGAVAIAIAKFAPIPEAPDHVFASLGIETAEDFAFPRLVACIAAVRVGAALLVNAEVGPLDHATGEGRKLKNKIKLSKHYTKDFAHSIGKTSRHSVPQLGPVALLFEAAAYKANPDAEDQD